MICQRLRGQSRYLSHSNLADPRKMLSNNIRDVDVVENVAVWFESGMMSNDSWHCIRDKIIKFIRDLKGNKACKNNIIALEKLLNHLSMTCVWIVSLSKYKIFLRDCISYICSFINFFLILLYEKRLYLFIFVIYYYNNSTSQN